MGCSLPAAPRYEGALRQIKALQEELAMHDLIAGRAPPVSHKPPNRDDEARMRAAVADYVLDDCPLRVDSLAQCQSTFRILRELVLAATAESADGAAAADGSRGAAPSDAARALVERITRRKPAGAAPAAAAPSAAAPAALATAAARATSPPPSAKPARRERAPSAAASAGPSPPPSRASPPRPRDEPRAAAPGAVAARADEGDGALTEAALREHASVGGDPEGAEAFAAYKAGPGRAANDARGDVKAALRDAKRRAKELLGDTRTRQR